MHELLQFAASGGAVKAIEMLIVKFKANPNLEIGGATAMHRAVRLDPLGSFTSISVKALEVLHRLGGDLDVKVNGETPIYKAISLIHYRAVKKLVELGADLAVEDLYERTPLEHASRRRSFFKSKAERMLPTPEGRSIIKKLNRIIGYIEKHQTEWIIESHRSSREQSICPF